MKKPVKKTKKIFYTRQAWAKDKWFDLKDWIGDKKILLTILLGLGLSTILAVKAWRTEELNHKNLKLAYENQEKKLKETEDKLKKTKVAKNVVKIIEKVVQPDGTTKETTKVTDLTRTDSTITTHATTDSETNVVLPGLTQRWGIGVGYQILGPLSLNPLERILVDVEYKFLDPLNLGAAWQIPDRLYLLGRLRF